MKSPSVSACMIVKNEDENLGPCLASLGDLAREVIVVDTGSTDDTVQVAESLGAKVHHFPWTGDFAAARNESLKHARGDWVFWLDADDRLSPKAVEQLKNAAASGEGDAYVCLVQSHQGEDTHDEVQHIRLFRNGLGVHFDGAIHESLGPSLNALHLRVVETDIGVEHIGYQSPELARRKSLRNVAILDRQLELNPKDVDLLFYRGRDLSSVGRLEDSLADLLEFLGRTDLNTTSAYKRISAYSMVVNLLEGCGRRAEVEKTLERALGEFPAHPQFLMLQGRVLMAAGRHEEAFQRLLAARASLHGERAIRPPSESWVELSLAEACRLLDRGDEARAWAARAHGRAPEWERAAAFLARLFLEAGRPTEAEPLLVKMLPSATRPETWLLMADLLTWQRRWEEAARALEKAKSRGLAPEQAEELARRLKEIMKMKSSSERKTRRAGTESRLGSARPRELPRNRAVGRRPSPIHFEISIEPIAPPRWPSISACMIVKNEAEHMAPCLASLEDLASEIIVVDTGSTDNTVEIATSLGAKVYHFPWIDDFAAARNESLRHATKEWVFWLDADDRLTPKAVAQLKRAAFSDKADAYACLVVSRAQDKGDDVVDHARLFRNGLGIRFDGAIHEMLRESLDALGLRVARTDIEVEHTGYQSEEAVRRKSARNLVMLDRELEKHPEKVDLLFYRGNARAGVGDAVGAAEDMRKFLASAPGSETSSWSRLWGLTVLSHALEKLGLVSELEALVEGAVEDFPRHPYFLMVKARMHIGHGRPGEALPLLHRAMDGMRDPIVGFRPSVVWLHLTLADCHRALGRAEEALRWAEEARKDLPAWEAPAVLLLRLCLETGRLKEAGEMVEELMPSTSNPEVFLLLAELLVRQKRWQEAAGALEEAKARGLAEEKAEELTARLMAVKIAAMTGSQGPGRRTPLKMKGLALLASNQPQEAADCFTEAINEAPADPDNHKYLAVALKKLGREEEAMRAWAQAARCGGAA